MNITEFEKLTVHIDGWMHKKEISLLYKLAKNLTPGGVIVEIGSWRGKSTVWLAYGSKNGPEVNVFAIDPHEDTFIHRESFVDNTFEDFMINISNAKVDDVIISIKKTSFEAAKEFSDPISLLFIDGDHSYASVREDFELWFPKLIDGGIIAFHDSALGWDGFVTVHNAGPLRFVKEAIYKSRRIRNIRIVKTITFAEKVQENSSFERLINRIKLIKIQLIEPEIKTLLWNKLPMVAKKGLYKILGRDINNVDKFSRRIDEE